MVSKTSSAVEQKIILELVANSPALNEIEAPCPNEVQHDAATALRHFRDLIGAGAMGAMASLILKIGQLAP